MEIVFDTKINEILHDMVPCSQIFYLYNEILETVHTNN